MNTLKEVRAADFAAEVVNAPTPVVVLFDAPDCVRCEALKPMIQEVSRSFRNEVEFVSVDVSASPDLAQRYRIVTLPTLGLFYDGVLRGAFTPSARSETSFAAPAAKVPETVPVQTAASADSYSARRSPHSVAFFCEAPQARTVSLLGDFNGWEPSAHPMTRMPDGQWMIRLELRHGYHRYLFLVDGKPRLDPRAQGTVHESNEWHEAASLIAVS